MLAASKRLEQLPLLVGDWQASGNDALDPGIIRLLQCAGSVNRTYENVKTGDRVTVMVLLGPSGPISVHTPDICYSVREYRIAENRKKWRLTDAVDEGDEFWDLRIQTNDLSGFPFRVLYGWTTGSNWAAVRNPRFSFGGSSYIYKLQLAGPIPGETAQRDACREFLIAFLPVLHKHLIQP